MCADCGGDLRSEQQSRLFIGLREIVEEFLHGRVVQLSGMCGPVFLQFCRTEELDISHAFLQLGKTCIDGAAEPFAEFGAKRFLVESGAGKDIIDPGPAEQQEVGEVMGSICGAAAEGLAQLRGVGEASLFDTSVRVVEDGAVVAGGRQDSETVAAFRVVHGGVESGGDSLAFEFQDLFFRLSVGLCTKDEVGNHENHHNCEGDLQQESLNVVDRLIGGRLRRRIWTWGPVFAEGGGDAVARSPDAACGRVGGGH